MTGWKHRFGPTNTTSNEVQKRPKQLTLDKIRSAEPIRSMQLMVYGALS